MKKFVALLIALTFVGCCSAKNCPPVPKHYEELRCTPLYYNNNVSGDECPHSFDCSLYENRDRSKCFFGGANYELRQSISNDLIEGSCSVNCYCRQNFEGKPKFECAHYDCPEFFNGRLAPDCIRQYRPNSCCATKTVCGAEREQLGRCVVNGETYFEGQKIDTGDRCYDCVCGKGWQDVPPEQNRHCRRINCHVDLHYDERLSRGCVPIYFGAETCCPIPEFRCPDAETKVLRAKNSDPPQDQRVQCVFGGLSMLVGDILSSTDRCVTCTCKVPPHVTCVRDRDC